MKKSGSIFIITAGILWGIINIFIRQLSAAELSSLQIAFIRLLFAAPMFTLYALIKSPALLKIRLKDLWMFVGTGIISIVLFNACYFYTIINGEASVAVVLLYTAPVFVMLLSAIIFKEKINGLKIAALILTMTGCVLVSGILSSSTTIKPMILFTGIMSGLLYALYTIFGRFALDKYSPITVTVYTFIVGLLGLLPVCDIGYAVKTVFTSAELILWSAGLGLFCTVLPYLTYNIGLKTTEPGKAAVLATVEPIVGSLIGIFLV